MGHQSYVQLCSKMTSFLPSEGVSKITFGSICSRSLWLSSIRFNQWGVFLNIGKFDIVIFWQDLFLYIHRTTWISTKKKVTGKKNILLIQDGMRQEKCPKNNNPPTPYSELWGIFISDTPILASLYGEQSYISQVVYKSVNLQYNTMWRWADGTIVPPSDGPMFILIDLE